MGSFRQSRTGFPQLGLAFYLLIEILLALIYLYVVLVLLHP